MPTIMAIIVLGNLKLVIMLLCISNDSSLVKSVLKNSSILIEYLPIINAATKILTKNVKVAASKI